MEPTNISLPYFPLYTTEFIADTQDLTDEEFGAYLRLLMYSWNKGGPVDKKRAVRLLDDSKNVWPVIEQFFIEKNGKIHNKRLEREREKSLELYERRSAAGKAGADARWQKHGNRNDDDNGEGSHQGNGNRNDESNDGGNSRKHGKQDSKSIARPIATQNSELRDKNTEKKELRTQSGGDITMTEFSHREENDSDAEKQTLEISSEFSNIHFPNMIVPRMLHQMVLIPFGPAALRYVLQRMTTVDDVRKRYDTAYIKAIIRDAPLLKIKTGEVDEQGHAPKEFSKEEALEWCGRNQVRMDQYFKTKKTEGGSPERFDDGRAKFFLTHPKQGVSRS